MFRTKAKSLVPSLKTCLSQRKGYYPAYRSALQLQEIYQSQNNLLYSQTQYRFSTHPKGTPNPQGFVKKTKIQNLTIDQFKSFIENKEQQYSNNYNYNNKATFALTDSFKEKPQIAKTTYIYKGYWAALYSFETTIWLPISYFFYTKISHPAVALPLLGWVFTVAWTRRAQLRLDNTLMKLELINDNEIMIYPWSHQGAGIRCKIEGANVKKVEVAKSKEDMFDESEGQDTVVLHVDFYESSPKAKKVSTIFRIAAGDTPIENLDLFKSILWGKTSEIPKYKYIGPFETEFK